MNKKERTELGEWIIRAARKNGADEVAVNISNRREIEIQYRDQKLEQLKESTRNGLSLTLYVKNRYSNQTTNDLRKSSLSTFIGDAVAMTGYLAADPYRSLPDPKYFRDMQNIDLKIKDPDYENVDSSRRKEFARKLEEAIRKQSDKIISGTGYYYDINYHAVKIHSNGFSGESESTQYGATGEVTVKDGEKGRPEGYSSATSRFLKDLPSADSLAEKCVNEALRKIGQSKMESGVYDMVVDNRRAYRLVGVLLDAMAGRALQQKSSFLEGKLGQSVGSEKLTLMDDPFIISGLGSRLYDREGMAARKRVLIGDGVLQNYLIDSYYAKKLEMEPTSGSTSNLVFRPGEESQEALVSKMKKGFLITGFIGGNSDPVTGDFSYGITGMYVENGKMVKPVNEMNISGNMTEFWQQLAAVGNDPYPYSAWRLPSLYFKDVQFSGI